MAGCTTWFGSQKEMMSADAVMPVGRQIE